MVVITCRKSKSEYKHLTFKGHAGFGRFGRDIVCSAVSVLFINTMNSIERFTDDRPRIKTKRKLGKQLIDVTFDKPITKETVLLLDSMMLGLNEIQKEYGDKYLSLIYEEE